MISTFLKKTWHTDLVKPLQVYLKDTYGKQKSKDANPHLLEIQQCRKSCMVDENSVSPPLAIEKHRKYLAYLSILEKRFAWGKSGKGMFKKAKKVEVVFKWVDSFRRTKIEQTNDIKCEKYAILFNLGCLLGLHAVKLSEQDEDGLKQACKLFRESAGVFEHISTEGGSEVIAFVQNYDMQKETCKFISVLMLAQAQACFVDIVCLMFECLCIYYHSFICLLVF